MRQLKRHQRAFIAGALGGPDLYRGRDMGSAHAGLGITSQAFDRVVAHLADALASAGVSDEIIGQIAGSLAPLRGVVTAVPA
jgi:hemoglobin